MNHLEYNNILTDCQHDFCSRRSCETQLLTFIHELARDMQDGGLMDIVLMDFAKAFDKVPHRRLLIKLSHYGIRGPLLSWIETFLINRLQWVVVDEEASDFTPVFSVVPQGTVLGLLLFLMFINDLPESTVSKTRLFADDAVLYRQIKDKNDCNIMQNDLASIAIWEKKWQMTFHPQKCKIMHFTRWRKLIKIQYTLRGNLLQTVSQAAYLGVELDDKLTWTPHKNQDTAKSTITLNFVRRSVRVASQSVKETAYKSLVRPALDYACTVWGSYTALLTNRVEMVQRRAARYV